MYTTIRAAGFTRHEIDQELFQNRFVLAPALQKFQQLKPESSYIDTVHSLTTEDPQHPPLYFLLARFWMQQFGSSIVASRLLPALLSLLSLPLIYQLAIALFASHRVALLATALLALSPLDIVFAQIARQYSLSTAVVIGTSWLLLRALRHPTRQNWGGYILGITIGLYTHTLFSLTLIAQGVYVLLMQRMFARFAIAVIIACGLYAPWLAMLLREPQRILSAAGWTSVEMPLQELAKQWMLNFTALFVNFNASLDNLWNILIRSLFACLILAALYAVYRGTARSTWLFLFSSLGIPFLVFLLPDLLLGGKRSAVSRYLVACYPSIQLSVAYLLAVTLTRRQLIGQGLFALILTGSLVSCSLNALADTSQYQETSYTNPEILYLLSTQTAIPSPVLVSDTGDGDTNVGDLIALSYALQDNVQLFMASRPPNLDAVQDKSTVFVFRPSEQMWEVMTQQGWHLEEVIRFGTVWQAENQAT
ncbi:MAG: glycosyltransferase family 39 protein [Cyanobacteria bacterium P01_D01_bin.44]